MKIEVSSALRYEDLLNGKDVMILEPFEVIIDGESVVVPAGFVSDLASVPIPFRALFPRFGPWNASAIVHDFLYVKGEIFGRPITQRFADLVFLRMMRANPRVGRHRAYPMYIGVRLGGYWIWRRNRRNERR